MNTNNAQPNRAKREVLFPPSIRTVMALAVLLLHTLSTSAQTVIGGLTAPDESAILDIRSTEQGVLFPRLSESERDAVESPASGLMIFNTTSICLEMNAGTPESPFPAMMLPYREYCCLVKKCQMPRFLFRIQEGTGGLTAPNLLLPAAWRG